MADPLSFRFMDDSKSSAPGREGPVFFKTWVENRPGSGALEPLGMWGHEGDSNVFTDVVHSAKALIQWVSLKRAIFELVLPFKEFVVSAPSNFHCRF
jgi:hypothetical protein